MKEVNDHYFYKAKKEKYLARSVYKLVEINEKFELIKRGHKVLDLGCAPGSWLQYVSDVVGPQGKVTGVDIKKITTVFPANVEIQFKSVYDLAQEFEEGAEPVLNCVISDMAPSTSGIRQADSLLSANLCTEVIRIADLGLKKFGNLIFKNFESGETPALLKEVQARFELAKIYKPLASRTESREIFIIGRRKKT